MNNDTDEFWEKYIFVDVISMSNYQEWMESDAFLAVVADSIANYPTIQEDFNRIYSGDKYRYYEAARNSNSYSELSMPRGRLTLEVAAKRNLGILLVARYDETVYQVIRPILLKIHPAIKDYINAPHKNTSYERTAFECIGNARLGIHKSISLLMVSAYIIYKERGKDSINYPICDGAAKYGEIYYAMENEFFGNAAQPKPSISDMLGTFRFTQEDWRYIKNLLRADYITLLRESYRRGESLLQYTSDPTESLSNYSDKIEREKIIVTAWALTSVMRKAGIDWENICGDYVLSKGDQANILNACLDMSILAGGYRPHQYIAAYIVYVLSREITAMRQFYWNNNAETQFLETAHLSKENKALRDRLVEVETQLFETEQRLAKAIEANNKRSQSDYYSATKPLREQNTALEKRVRELESQLVESKKSQAELEQLRSLVLPDDYGSGKKAADISLDLVFQERKIVVLGGSLNLRKKLAQKYPGLIVLDGTETIVDLRMLDNAEMVIFYTFNMSHSIYERTMTYVRQKEIPFAYLSRASNTELIEEQLKLILSNYLVNPIER